MRTISHCALIMLAATALPLSLVSAQSTPPTRAPSAQPKIIVIPFTKENEDIRTILEADFNRQVAVAKVKKAFETRKFSTIDFQAALAAMKRDIAVGAESSRDFRDRLLETYKADIYVVVNYKPNVNAGLTQVDIIMESYLTANGLSLATEYLHSRSNREPNVAAHIELAIDELSPAFLDGMQEKFDEFQVSGVPLQMTVQVASGSAINLFTVPKGMKESLTNIIEDWATEHSVDHGASATTSGKNKMLFPDFRIPVRAANGTPVSARRFTSGLTDYLRSLGVEATLTVSNGAIYVDIQ